MSETHQAFGDHTGSRLSLMLFVILSSCLSLVSTEFTPTHNSAGSQKSPTSMNQTVSAWPNFALTENNTNSPMCLQTEPPAVRSGYVHLASPHTGRLCASVPTDEKEKHLSGCSL